MTTQLPNGYEAVKVPEGAEHYRRFIGKRGLWIMLRIQQKGRCFFWQREKPIKKLKEVRFVQEDKNEMLFLTKRGAQFLASLHLEPHTTIILKKENV